MVTEIAGFERLVPKDVLSILKDYVNIPANSEATLDERSFTRPIRIVNIVVGFPKRNICLKAWVKNKDGSNRTISWIYQCDYMYDLVSPSFFDDHNVEKNTGLFRLVADNESNDTCAVVLNRPIWCYGWKINAKSFNSSDLWGSVAIVAEVY